MLAADIHFAEKVGVAPSTTTIELRGSPLGIQCFPIPSPQERAVWLGKMRTQSPRPAPKPALGSAAIGRRRVYNPYALEAEMRGFGVVDPNDAWDTGDVNRLYMHGTTVVKFNPRRGGGFTSQVVGTGMGVLGLTNGEANRSLSGLGTVPNDDELARNLCYTPVHSGWIYGESPTGKRYYADGLYDALPTLLTDDPDALAEVVKIQRRQMIFQGITTAAIVGMAAASIWTVLRGSPRKAAVKKSPKKRHK
jgi:hypothetical protein